LAISFTRELLTGKKEKINKKFQKKSSKMKFNIHLIALKEKMNATYACNLIIWKKKL